MPAPPPPKGNTVQGKPRNFLPYAPSWAKHPDYDRVRLQGPCTIPPCYGLSGTTFLQSGD